MYSNDRRQAIKQDLMVEDLNVHQNGCMDQSSDGMRDYYHNSNLIEENMQKMDPMMGKNNTYYQPHPKQGYDSSIELAEQPVNVYCQKFMHEPAYKMSAPIPNYYKSDYPNRMEMQYRMTASSTNQLFRSTPIEKCNTRYYNEHQANMVKNIYPPVKVREMMEKAFMNNFANGAHSKNVRMVPNMCDNMQYSTEIKYDQLNEHQSQQPKMSYSPMNQMMQMNSAEQSSYMVNMQSPKSIHMNKHQNMSVMRGIPSNVSISPESVPSYMHRKPMPMHYKSESQFVQASTANKINQFNVVPNQLNQYTNVPMDMQQPLQSDYMINTNQIPIRNIGKHTYYNNNTYNYENSSVVNKPDVSKTKSMQPFIILLTPSSKKDIPNAQTAVNTSAIDFYNTIKKFMVQS